MYTCDIFPVVNALDDSFNVYLHFRFLLLFFLCDLWLLHLRIRIIIYLIFFHFVLLFKLFEYNKLIYTLSHSNGFHWKFFVFFFFGLHSSSLFFKHLKTLKVKKKKTEKICNKLILLYFFMCVVGCSVIPLTLNRYKNVCNGVIKVINIKIAEYHFEF